MSREVEGLENLNKILTLPIGSKFGMFADNSMNLFKVAGYIDRVAKTSECSFAVDTVFMDLPVGSVVTHPPVQNGTETFFISMIELNNAKL